MWILPSRSRPENLERFIGAYLDTGAGAKVYVRLDECDPHIEQNVKLSGLMPRHWTLVVGKRVRMPGALNEAFERFPNELSYGIMGDDIVPRTELWDVRLNLAAGKWNIVYGDDLQNGESHATHPLMGGDLARAIGWLALPNLVHLYNDTVWMAIGTRLGVLKYCPAVVMEHMHFSNGKAPFDSIYKREVEGVDYASLDNEVFDNWEQSELDALCERLKEYY